MSESLCIFIGFQLRKFVAVYWFSVQKFCGFWGVSCQKVCAFLWVFSSESLCLLLNFRSESCDFLWDFRSEALYQFMDFYVRKSVRYLFRNIGLGQWVWFTGGWSCVGRVLPWSTINSATTWIPRASGTLPHSTVLVNLLSDIHWNNGSTYYGIAYHQSSRLEIIGQSLAESSIWP